MRIHHRCCHDLISICLYSPVTHRSRGTPVASSILLTHDSESLLPYVTSPLSKILRHQRKNTHFTTVKIIQTPSSEPTTSSRQHDECRVSNTLNSYIPLYWLVNLKSYTVNWWLVISIINLRLNGYSKTTSIHYRIRVSITQTAPIPPGPKDAREFPHGWVHPTRAGQEKRST